jgi:hypothetical protein
MFFFLYCSAPNRELLQLHVCALIMDLAVALCRCVILHYADALSCMIVSRISARFEEGSVLTAFEPFRLQFFVFVFLTSALGKCCNSMFQVRKLELKM